MALTYNYLYPVVGTTPPTLAQAANANTVVVTVSASAAGDTSAAVTHNFNFSNADISAGFPMLIFADQDGSEITSSWFELSEQANYTVLGKGSLAVGGSIKVFITRPHSIFR
jgi:hypothetical protein